MARPGVICPPPLMGMEEILEMPGFVKSMPARELRA